MIEMSVLGADDASKASDEQPLLDGHGNVQGASKGHEGKTETGAVRLRKELSVLHGVGMLITDIIGSGIFLSPNSVIARTGSYGLAIIVWIVSGLIAAGGALCYAELSTFVRKSGADYAYIQEAYSFKRKTKFVRTFGKLISFTYLWMNFLISDPMSLAISGLLAAEYLVKPFYLSCDPPILVLKMLAIVFVGMLHGSYKDLNSAYVVLLHDTMNPSVLIILYPCACDPIYGSGSRQSIKITNI